MALDVRDAKYLKEKPEGRAARAGTIKARWWEVDDEERAALVVATGETLETYASERHAVMIRHARLYENMEFDSFRGRDYADAMVRQILLGSGFLSLNVGAACVDTLLAKVTKNRPRPTFLTSGGSWDAQIKGRNLDKWARGYFYETKVYQHARHVALDAYEFGTGFLQVYPTEGGKLACDRVLPSEILVDDMDGQYGCPRQMFRVKSVSKDVLIRMFPKKEMEIRDAGKSERHELDSVQATPEVAEDTVTVYEGWHLPSGPGAKDGMHVIAIDGCVLEKEQWKIDKFPFVVMRFKRRTTGFWGKGVIETVQPIQVQLNRALQSIALQMKRKGKGRTYVQIGSKVVPSHLTNNDGGDIVYYTGTPPQDAAHNVIAQEEFAWVDRLYQKAFQECGISELSAAARKPSGLDAAVALREYNDIESERFAPQHQDWDQFFLDFTELSIDLITKQYGWGAYKVLVPGRRDLLTVDWKDVNLSRDSYVMQMFPTSSLPQTPSARYQKVKEMMQDGFIDKPVAQRLLEYPDIEAESNLGNAMLDDVDATISAILDAEEPKLIPLEPYQNLDLIIQRTNAAYLYARHRGCPENRLMLLRQLMDMATGQKAAMAAPPPGPAMPGMPPGAPPMPGAPQPGMPDITNTVNAAPPVSPAVPPIVA